MKHAIGVALLILTVLAANSAIGGHPPKSTPPVTLSFDLVDGSRVVGVPSIKEIGLHTNFAKLSLALSLIRSVEFGPDHDTAIINLRNGDRLTGKLTTKELDLKTSFGEVAVPLAKVVRASVNGGAVVLDGLILHYSFDETTDGTVPDATGKNPAAKLHQAKITADGKQGNGLLLSDPPSYMTFSDENLPMENLPRTLALWFKTTPSEHAQYLFTYGKSAPGEVYMGIYDNSKVLTLGEYGNRYPEGEGHSTVTDGVWHHAVMVFDGDKTVTVYLDGETEFIATRRYRTVPRGTGCLSAYASAYSLRGTLDEFMVFNRALSADEVKTLYASQK